MSEGKSVPAVSPRRSKFKKIPLGIFAVIAIGAVAARLWYHYTFPYGWNHACSKVLGMELWSYGEDHEHWLPHGETTPEASLGTLYKDNTNEAAWMLGGKNIPRETVEA